MKWNMLRRTIMTASIICCTILLHAQNIGISGIVTDAGGEPVVGANVSEKGTANGTGTDANGAYRLNVKENGTLVFSYIGYVTREIKVTGDETAIDVIMQEDTEALDEVVVVGYGTQKKVNLAGAISTVSAEKLTQTPSANLTNAVAGRLSGVLATNSNGEPGSGSTLQIRGLSTLKNNSPLIVIDGIISGDFSQIDPNEIQSITVLKDASSAIYGARAANGVFLVTTKRGNVGKPKISYNGMVGIQQPTQYTKLMTPYEYAVNKNKAYLNMGYDPNNPAQAPNFYSDDLIARMKAGTWGVNWQEESFQDNAPETQHNLSVNGGTDAIRYFLSTGYFNQKGMFENMDFNRYNLRANVDAKITRHLDIGLNVEGRQTNNNLLGTNIGELFFDMVAADPARYQAPYYPDGKPVDPQVRNPVENPKSGGYERQRTNYFQGVLSFEQRLPFVTPGLSVKGNAAFNYNYYFSKRFVKPFTMYVEDENGNVTSAIQRGTALALTENFENTRGTVYNISLNYARVFGSHDVSAMLLYEQAESTGDRMNGTKQDYATDVKDELSASGTANQSFSGSSVLNEARRSLVGRANYAFNSRYLLEFSFRYDGSYRFPKETRFGFFPSVLLAWRISEESFFKKSGLDFVDNLKLRISKGLIGNDRVDAFQFMDSYSFNAAGPVFGGAQEMLINYGVYPNPVITWEKQDNNNVGIDLSMWKGLLSIEADAFYRKTRDILWSRDRSVPGTFGRSLPNENYAQMQSQGFDLTVGHQNRINDWQYSLQLTGTYATNKVTQVDDPSSRLDYEKQLNRPVGFRVGYESLGFFQSNEEAAAWYGGQQFGQNSIAGDIKYADVDGDGEITNRDQKVLSNNGYAPKLMFGLSFGLKWKNFDFDIFAQGAAMRTVLINTMGRTMYIWALCNSPSYLADSWSSDNRDAKYPVAWIDSRSINDRTSSVWLKDAAYVRLKSASLGYTVRQEKLQAIGIERLRVYVSGFNLLTLSQVKEFDPEAEDPSARYYPQQRNFNLGVNISF
ncbi:MAG: TonB-dependent receptor [Tannerella sp.]|nr:TonB-dependent receptor [Tannerella sp.]